MSSDCKIEERAVQPVASIRTRSSVSNLPQTLGECYGKVFAYLQEMGVQPSYAPFAGYFNMDMEDLDLEIGFPVAEPVSGKGEVQASVIPAGKKAVAIHTGPYEDFGRTYDALQAYIDEHGEEGQGIAYEFYLNDPGEVKPEELQTEIVILLK